MMTLIVSQHDSEILSTLILTSRMWGKGSVQLHQVNAYLLHSFSNILFALCVYIHSINLLGILSFIGTQYTSDSLYSASVNQHIFISLNKRPVDMCSIFFYPCFYTNFVVTTFLSIFLFTA